MCGCALLDKDKYDDKHSDSVSLCPDSWYFITTDIVIATSYMLKSVIGKGIIEGAIKKFWECGKRRGWALLEILVRLLLILFANKTHCSGMGGGISHIESPCHNFLFHNFVSFSFKSKCLSVSSLISIWSSKIWKGVMQPLAGWPEGLRELGKNFATPPCPALPSWTCTTFNVQLVQLSTRETTWTRLENAAFLYQPHSIVQVSL